MQTRWRALIWPSDLKLYPKYWHSRLSRGFGLGVGPSYLPWIRVRDIGSVGDSGVPMGITTSRRHHLLSKLERTYFFLLERQHDVSDVREQFPILHLHGTLQICASLGIQHTRRAGYPEPFTLDFVVTRQTSAGPVHQARSVKTPEDAKDPAVRRRLQVEHMWCKQNDIDWKLVDTTGFSNDLFSTLVFLRGWHRHGHRPTQSGCEEFSEAFRRAYSRNTPLNELLSVCSKKMGVSQAQAQDAFRFCGWANWIKVDISQKLSLHLPVVLHGDE